MDEAPLVPRGQTTAIGAIGAKALFQGGHEPIEVAGIPADKNFAGVDQGGLHGLAAGYFAEAADSTVADEFDDDAQGIGSVQAGGIKQGRVADGDGSPAPLVSAVPTIVPSM